MKKLYYLIVLALILGLVLTGCLLSNVGQVPTPEQSGITYLTKGVPINVDLVGLWRFDGDANDSSGTTPPNNGTVYGATYDLISPMGQALSFDGDGDYVEVADSASLDITGDLTIEAWVKFDSFASPHSFVVGKDTTGQRSYGLFVDGGYYAKTGKVGFIVFSASSYTIHWGDTALNTGQWYHIAGTYDYVANGTSVMEVYVNGNSDSTATNDAVGPIYSGSANLQIGARQYPPDYWRCFVDGLIDEVRIWNGALLEEHLGSIIYDFGGILPPIKTDGSRAFKLGSTVPVKFQLWDADGNIVTNAEARIFVTKIDDNGTSEEIAVVSTAAATTGNLFRYDPDSEQYIFNLSTKLPLNGVSWSIGTWQIRIKLDDGTSKFVNIILR